MVVGADDVAFRRGGISTLTYSTVSDGTTRVSAVQPPLGGPNSLTYNSNGQVSTVTGPLGGVTTLLWNNSGNRIGVIDALGNQTSYLYNARGCSRARSTRWGTSRRCSMMRSAGCQCRSTRCRTGPVSDMT